MRPPRKTGERKSGVTMFKGQRQKYKEKDNYEIKYMVKKKNGTDRKISREV